MRLDKLNFINLITQLSLHKVATLSLHRGPKGVLAHQQDHIANQETGQEASFEKAGARILKGNNEFYLWVGWGYIYVPYSPAMAKVPMPQLKGQETRSFSN